MLMFVILFSFSKRMGHCITWDDYGKAMLWIDPRVGVWKMCEFRARGLPSILHRPSMVKMGGRVIVMGLVERWKATANSDLETKVGVWCAETQSEDE